MAPIDCNPQFLSTVPDITWLFFVCNFVGIVCARSLHFQFYVWYYHSLPFLLYHISKRGVPGSWSVHALLLRRGIFLFVIAPLLVCFSLTNNGIAPIAQDPHPWRDRDCVEHFPRQTSDKLPAMSCALFPFVPAPVCGPCGNSNRSRSQTQAQ